LKTLNDPIGNRIYDLPACSTVRLHTRLYILYKTVFVSQEFRTRRRCECLRVHPRKFTHQEFVNKLFKREKKQIHQNRQLCNSRAGEILYCLILFILFSTVNYCIFTFRFLLNQVFYYVHLQQNSEGLSSFRGEESSNHKPPPLCHSTV